MDYSFTSDWVTSKSNIWNKVLIPVKPFKSILEVGSYEGRATIWFIENLLDSEASITCIDNWSWGQTEVTFDKNISIAISSRPNVVVNKLTGDSQNKLAELLVDKKFYDLVYIDGECNAAKRLMDACSAWSILAINGIMVFDDYLHITKDTDLKLAIDYFCTIFQGKYKYLYIGQQVIIQKVRE